MKKGERKMNVTKEQMERIVAAAQAKKMFEDICPRCGGKLKPENPFPYGGGLSVSRLADVSICPKCGTKEAMSDFENQDRIRGDFSGYVSDELSKWNILKSLFNTFDEIYSRRIMIETLESSLYTGENVDGEEVIVLLEQGQGMEVKTRHTEKPDWYECVHYDKDGYQEAVSYEHIEGD